MSSGDEQAGHADALLDEARLTRTHVRIWLLAAMGVLLDGFDLFILGVALPLIEEDLGPSDVEVGLLTGAAVIGAVVGASTLGRLTDRIGRTRVFVIDIAMFVVFAVASGLAWNVWSLIAFRFLLGIGVGADYPISASYVAEIAPLRHRQRLLVGAFAFQAVGMLLGAAVGVVVLNVEPDVGAWRWMLAIGAVPALIIAVLRIGVPESPRWLAGQGHKDEAAEVVSLLIGRRVPPEAIAEPTPEVPMRELFRGTLRRRTILSTVPWFFMDIATYGVGVFTPTILAALALSGPDSTFIADDIASAEGSAVLDLFLVAGFTIAIAVITRVDRLKLQMVGFGGMIAGLCLLAVAVAGGDGTGDDHLVLVFAGFILFNLLMNAGPNATTYLVPAEVFPTRVRATGHGLAAACGKTGAAVGLVLFPIAQDDLGLTTTLLIIAAGCAVAAAVTWRFRCPPATE